MFRLITCLVSGLIYVVSLFLFVENTDLNKLDTLIFGQLIAIPLSVGFYMFIRLLSTLYASGSRD